MKAVILAAGRGKRLAPHTDTVPKPMVPVLGRPILEYTLNNLPDSITEVILVTGYLGDKIEDHFGEEWGGKPIKYVRQHESSGTFSALCLARDFLDNEFLVLFADDFYVKSDIEKLLKHERAVLAHEVEDVTRFGICTMDDNGRLIEIIEKPQHSESRLANIGVYKLTGHIFNEEIVVGPSGENFLAPMIGNLAKKMDISVERADFWHPIAYPEDLDKAEKILGIWMK